MIDWIETIVAAICVTAFVIFCSYIIAVCYPYGI